MTLDAIALLAGFFSYLVQMRVQMHVAELCATAAVFAYVLLSVAVRKPRYWMDAIKVSLLCIVMLCTVVTSLSRSIGARMERGLHTNVHDHPLQMEAAVEFLLIGKNPYAMSYQKTPMGLWWPQNPALTHVIALPATILKSVPVSVLWKAAFGWYDERIAQLFLLMLGLLSMVFLFRSKELRFAAMILFVFNPLFLPFFLEGRSDIVFLSFLLAALACLRWHHKQEALLFLALAVTSKHMAWFIVPFIGTYLAAIGYFRTHVIQKVFPSIAVAAIIVLPFLLWDWRAFFEDIVSYPAGTIPTSYPINGYSFAVALKNVGWLGNSSSAYPAWLFELSLIPLLLWLLKDLYRRPSIGRLFLYYGLFLWPVLFFTRFFHDNYMGAILGIVIVGVLLLRDEHFKAASRHARIPF